MLIFLRTPVRADMSLGEWPAGNVAVGGQVFFVTASDSAALGWHAVLFSPSGVVDERANGPSINVFMRLPKEDEWATLRLMRLDPLGETCVKDATWRLSTPGQVLIEDWIRAIVDDDGAVRRSDSVSAPGQCKRYLINVFAEVAQGYRMAEFPSKPLAMPTEHNGAGEGKLPAGVGWTLPSASAGNPFVEIARFVYNGGKTKQENREDAYACLGHIRRGDVFQMLATFSNGVHGTHTGIFTRAFSPHDKALYWADSNFKNEMVDGIRYGYVIAFQKWGKEEVIGWLLNAGNGMTIYRLREDIILW